MQATWLRSTTDLTNASEATPSASIGLAASPHQLRDCDELIDTVKLSLWSLIDGTATDDRLPAARDDPALLRSTTALRGAMALEQLQTTLAQEFQLRDQLEREVREAQGALEHARAKMAGLQAEERRASYRAAHDDLTNLPNRSYFRTRLAHCLEADTSPREGLAVMFLDLDGFKPINDVYGHAAGDELLRIVATRLLRALRSEDTVSRMGGDEFACLLLGLSTPDQVAQVAEKLLKAIQAPCKIGDHLIGVGASIGISIYPAHGTTGDDLLLKADLAMYRAKRQRIGFAFYEDGSVTAVDIEI